MFVYRYEQESQKLGKASFMYAWVLDETGEERTRFKRALNAHFYNVCIDLCFAVSLLS